MSYREPDPESAMAKAAAADLARLADVGRLRKRARDEAQAHDEAATRAIALAPSSSMFRTRFEPSSFRVYAGLYAAFSVVFIALTFVFAGSGGEVAWGILMSITFFAWLFSMPIGWIVQAIRKRTHAQSVLAWHAGLPFAFPTFVSLLSAKGTLTAGSLRVTLAPDADLVSDTIVSGLIGLTSLPNADVAIVGAGRTFTIEAAASDPALAPWVREVIEKVLLPIHAAHTIAEVELTASVDG